LENLLDSHDGPKSANNLFYHKSGKNPEFNTCTRKNKSNSAILQFAYDYVFNSFMKSVGIFIKDLTGEK
jgi:hypothetical protein